MTWDKIEQLLNICERARHWPRLQHIHDAAMKELEEIKAFTSNEPEEVEDVSES